MIENISEEPPRLAFVRLGEERCQFKSSWSIDRVDWLFQSTPSVQLGHHSGSSILIFGSIERFSCSWGSIVQVLGASASSQALRSWSQPYKHKHKKHQDTHDFSEQESNKAQKRNDGHLFIIPPACQRLKEERESEWKRPWWALNSRKSIF